MNSTRVFNPAMRHLVSRRRLGALGAYAYFKKPTPGQMWSIGTDHPAFKGKKFVNVTFDQGGSPGVRDTDWAFSDTAAWFGPNSNPGRIVIEYADVSAAPAPSTPAPAAPAGPTLEQQDWLSIAKSALRQLKEFRDSLAASTGSVDPDTPYTYTLTPPPSGTPGGQEIYDEWVYWRDSLPNARSIARISWRPPAPAATTSPTTTSPTSPGTTTGAGYAFPNAGSDVYDVQYSSGTLIVPNKAQATIVPVGGANTPPPEPAKTSRSPVGLLLLAGALGLGVYAWRRRKRAAK